jgi:hypothetical protein
MQGLTLGTDVDVSFGVVSELILAKQGTAFIMFGQRHVGMDTGLLHGHHILDGAVGCIASDRAWLQMPTEAAPEQEIQHGEVFGDLCRSY